MPRAGERSGLEDGLEVDGDAQRGAEDGDAQADGLVPIHAEVVAGQVGRGTRSRLANPSDPGRFGPAWHPTTTTDVLLSTPTARATAATGTWPPKKLVNTASGARWARRAARVASSGSATSPVIRSVALTSASSLPAGSIAHTYPTSSRSCRTGWNHRGAMQSDGVTIRSGASAKRSRSAVPDLSSQLRHDGGGLRA